MPTCSPAQGLADALAGADVLVDVVNSPSFDDGPVMDFFTSIVGESGRRPLRIRVSATTSHCPSSEPTACPKAATCAPRWSQEKAIVESGLPYTIVRATQFHEFAAAITGSLVVGDEVRVPDARIQPIAAADVAAEV